MINEIRKLTDSKRARFVARFFKTGRGGYAKNDKFLGLTVPQCRTLAKKFISADLKSVQKLLVYKYHEALLIALLILTYRFEKADEREQKRIFDLYVANTKWVNNWDLVDASAYKIVGTYLFDKPRSVLYKLVKSNNIWERRIAMVSTYQFIRHNQFADTLKISEILLTDKHDLIHKAVGWMLRETGKRSEKTLVKFLNKNAARMPRTTLRYSIERFPEKQRLSYLHIKNLTT